MDMKQFAILVFVIMRCIAGYAVTYAEVDWQQFKGTTIHFMVSEHPFIRYITPKLDEFEGKTGIEVLLDIFPAEQYQEERFLALRNGEQPAGFMIMPGQSKLLYWNAGWLLPLDGLIADPTLTEADWDIDDFFAGSIQGMSIEGQQIAVVINVETSILAYRKDLFEEFQVNVPETMEELEAAAKFFHGKSIRDKTIVGITLRGEGAAATSQWVDFLYSFGGSWLDDDGKINIASPESIAAFKFYGDLLRNYGPDGANTFHWKQNTAMFMKGSAAMIFDTNMFRALYEHPQQSIVAGKVGYTTIPAGPAGKVPHVSSWSFAISATSPSEHQKAAWLFIQWATNKEHALEALLAGVPVGRASTWESEKFRANDPHPDWTTASVKSFEIGQPQWNPPVLNIPESRDIVGQVILDAIDGKDVADSAEYAMELLEEILPQ